MEDLKCSGASLPLLFRRFFVRSNSVKHGSNDTERKSDGHVELVDIRSTSGDDGTSLIYTAIAPQCYHKGFNRLEVIRLNKMKQYTKLHFLCTTFVQNLNFLRHFFRVTTVISIRQLQCISYMTLVRHGERP